jgi:hypothetical protein
MLDKINHDMRDAERRRNPEGQGGRDRPKDKKKEDMKVASDEFEFKLHFVRGLFRIRLR